MGTTCLATCPECNRHVRCGEHACPFCGARVSVFMRVLEYRLKTRLGRGLTLSMGAALTAAGFMTSCSSTVAEYGAPCSDYGTCPRAGSAGVANQGGLGGLAGGGQGGVGGSAGHLAAGGAAGEPTPPEGGAGGDAGAGGGT